MIFVTKPHQNMIFQFRQLCTIEGEVTMWGTMEPNFICLLRSVRMNLHRKTLATALSMHDGIQLNSAKQQQHSELVDGHLYLIRKVCPMGRKCETSVQTYA